MSRRVLAELIWELPQAGSTRSTHRVGAARAQHAGHNEALVVRVREVITLLTHLQCFV